jgi:hypothetical protein
VLSLLAVLALVVLLALAVLASMVIENWGRLVVPLPACADGADRVPESDQGLAPDQALGSDQLHDPVELVLVGRDAADRTVAVLLASYAAQRRPEANRVAAWVTAAARPAGRHAAAFEPGADLRARPAAVATLLDCADEGRCWLTLSTRTDIGRGVRSRPPQCEVLGGLIVLWHATRAAMTTVSPEDVALALAAVDSLRPRWSVCTGGPDVEPVAEALHRAAQRGVGLSVRVPLATVGGVEQGAPAQTGPACTDPALERSIG